MIDWALGRLSEPRESISCSHTSLINNRTASQMFSTNWTCPTNLPCPPRLRHISTNNSLRLSIVCLMPARYRTSLMPRSRLNRPKKQNGKRLWPPLNLTPQSKRTKQTRTQGPATTRRQELLLERPPGKQMATPHLHLEMQTRMPQK